MKHLLVRLLALLLCLPLTLGALAEPAPWMSERMDRLYVELRVGNGYDADGNYVTIYSDITYYPEDGPPVTIDRAEGEAVKRMIAQAKDTWARYHDEGIVPGPLQRQNIERVVYKVNAALHDRLEPLMVLTPFLLPPI